MAEGLPKRLARASCLAFALSACGVEDFGKDPPITQVPVEPPPPPEDVPLLTIALDQAVLRTVIGEATHFKAHVAGREKLASVLTISMGSGPTGASLKPVNLAIGQSDADLTLYTTAVPALGSDDITLELASIRGQESSKTVRLDVRGRPGTLDYDFYSPSGTVRLGGPSGTATLRFDPLDRILVLGSDAMLPQSPRAGVARLMTDGYLDYAYGTEGSNPGVVHPTQDTRVTEFPTGFAVGDDGSAFVAIDTGGAFGPPFVAKLLASGKLDPTFGAAGRLEFPGSSSTSSSLAMDGSKLVVLGMELQDFRSRLFLRRFLPSGEHDPSFATDWMALDNRLGFSPRALVKRPSGGFAFLMAGSTFTIGVVGVDGVPTASFGSGGLLSLATEIPSPTSIAAAGDALYVAGSTIANGVQSACIVKLDAKGAHDPTFGVGGLSKAPRTQRFVKIAVDTSGRVLTLGTSSDGLVETVLERWLPNGAPDVSFGVGGRAYGRSGADSWVDLALRTSGRIVVLARQSTFVPPMLQLDQYWD